MGAQQAWEWGVRFPERLRRLALFAGTARTTPHGTLLVEAAAESLRDRGLAAHARYWASTALSADLFRYDTWRAAGFASVDDLVERLFVDDFAGLEAEILLRQSANGGVPTSRHTQGDLAQPWAVSPPPDRVLFSHDAVFRRATARRSKSWSGSELRIVESVRGHYAWGITESDTR